MFLRKNLTLTSIHDWTPDRITHQIAADYKIVIRVPYSEIL